MWVGPLLCSYKQWRMESFIVCRLWSAAALRAGGYTDISRPPPTAPSARPGQCFTLGLLSQEGGTKGRNKPELGRGRAEQNAIPAWNQETGSWSFSLRCTPPSCEIRATQSLRALDSSSVKWIQLQALSHHIMKMSWSKSVSVLHGAGYIVGSWKVVATIILISIISIIVAISSLCKAREESSIPILQAKKLKEKATSQLA